VNENSAGGASSVMNYVDLTVIANSVCAGVYGSTTVASTCICTAADAAKSICSVGVLQNIFKINIFVAICTKSAVK
jgi:hypothetical protein